MGPRAPLPPILPQRRERRENPRSPRKNPKEKKEKRCVDLGLEPGARPAGATRLSLLAQARSVLLRARRPAGAGASPSPPRRVVAGLLSLTNPAAPKLSVPTRSASGYPGVSGGGTGARRLRSGGYREPRLEYLPNVRDHDAKVSAFGPP